MGGDPPQAIPLRPPESPSLVELSGPSGARQISQIQPTDYSTTAKFQTDTISSNSSFLCLYFSFHNLLSLKCKVQFNTHPHLQQNSGGGRGWPRAAPSPSPEKQNSGGGRGWPKPAPSPPPEKQGSGGGRGWPRTAPSPPTRKTAK